MPGSTSSVTARCWAGRSSAPASLPVLFAEQVARTPDAVALVCGDRSLTYRGAR